MAHQFIRSQTAKQRARNEWMRAALWLSLEEFRWEYEAASELLISANFGTGTVMWC